MHSIESRCVIGPEYNYTVCGRVLASFSPEILRAGAVKGLSHANTTTTTTTTTKAKQSDGQTRKDAAVCTGLLSLVHRN